MPNTTVPAAGGALPAAHLNLDYRRSLRDVRRQAEEEVERLLDLLDKIAPDDELEADEDFEDDPSDREPSLGCTGAVDQSKSWRGGEFADLDLEMQVDDGPIDEDELDDDGDWGDHDRAEDDWREPGYVFEPHHARMPASGKKLARKPKGIERRIEREVRA